MRVLVVEDELRMAALLKCGLQVADLRLNPATRQAWRGDTELELSAKEFALLELFLRHPGEVLTRTRSLEHVGDLACDGVSDGVSNVVDQYVLYLHRKVDRPFGVEQPETVRRGIPPSCRVDRRRRDMNAC